MSERASGRGRLLKQNEVAPGAGTVSVPAAQLPRPREAPAATGGQPEVKLVRGPDGTVQQIRVRCPCGRETTLQCEYPVSGGKP
jgi:hypothetical protein